MIDLTQRTDIISFTSWLGPVGRKIYATSLVGGHSIKFLTASTDEHFRLVTFREVLTVSNDTSKALDFRPFRVEQG